MKKIIKRKPVGPDITDLVSKISGQLVSLEKKLDTLISQSSDMPSRPFDEIQHRPFDETQHRRFDRPQRYGQRNQDNRPRERSLNQVVCAECKKTCEVPFRPSGDRPVYCRDCFAKRRDSSSFKGNRDDRPRERGFAPRFETRKKSFSRRSHPVEHRRK